MLPVYHQTCCRYEGANNKEDDIAIISKTCPLVPDDVGNSITNATRLQVPGSFNGLISFGGDIDVFSFNANKGAVVTITLALADTFVWNSSFAGSVSRFDRSNLNAEVVLMDSAGLALKSWSGSSSLLQGALKSDALPNQGRYFLRITGVGQGPNFTAGARAGVCGAVVRWGCASVCARTCTCVHACVHGRMVRVRLLRADVCV